MGRVWEGYGRGSIRIYPGKPHPCLTKAFQVFVFSLSKSFEEAPTLPVDTPPPVLWNSLVPQNEFSLNRVCLSLESWEEG